MPKTKNREVANPTPAEIPFFMLKCYQRPKSSNQTAFVLIRLETQVPIGLKEQ
jgi:hypothetical protein